MNPIKEQWNKVIAEKLKEGVTVEDLAHTYPSGIVMEPNVLKSDIDGYNHAIPIHTSWTNMASIQGSTSADKNKLALQALQEGANGLHIELSHRDAVSDILKGVLTEYLDVRIDASALSVEELNIQKSSLSEEAFPNVKWIHHEDNVLPYTISKEKRVESIQSMIKKIDASKPADIVVTLSKNLLFEIASLRAIRALVDAKQNAPLQIIARYEVEGTNTLGDYDLIEKTYKVLSGILGGADAILTPYHGDENSRLTLNIHNVLDLESGMKNVLDPLKGSYYIEKLTGEIIRQVNA